MKPESVVIDLGRVRDLTGAPGGTSLIDVPGDKWRIPQASYHRKISNQRYSEWTLTFFPTTFTSVAPMTVSSFWI
ncbi:MAG: hypothetical protein ACREV5_11000 [Steroidobacter sp.]